MICEHFLLGKIFVQLQFLSRIIERSIYDEHEFLCVQTYRCPKRIGRGIAKRSELVNQGVSPLNMNRFFMNSLKLLAHIAFS